jgi:deazaflavin-dependent oxidoreductase (nitroreductase family)
MADHGATRLRPELARLPFCYLTTTGRRTDKPHRIEIWFAVHPERPIIYLLSGGRDRSDWVHNLRSDARCTVEIGVQTFNGMGRLITNAEEDALARTLVFEKYRDDDDLEEWRVSALPVAIELTTRD